MRLQLLAAEAETAKEMDADIVSVMHVAPRMNKDLMTRITSPGLKSLGNNIHEIWKILTMPGKFNGVYLEDLIPRIKHSTRNQEWAKYLSVRYGGS